MADNWEKLVNSDQFSDVRFRLRNKVFFAHKYVLCSASDLMRQLFGVTDKVKMDSLCQCPEWTAKKLKAVSADSVNNGKVRGFVSFAEENE